MTHNNSFKNINPKNMAPSTVFSERQRSAEIPAAEVAKLSISPNDDLTTALALAKARFVDRNPNSLKLYEEALKSLPGGNTRTLLYTSPFPVSMKSGKGYQVTDEDGHT